MKKHKKLILLLIIITVAFIWIHSIMPPDVSGDESQRVVEILENVFGDGNVDEHFVRKLAHFTEFFILGLELMTYFDNMYICAFHGLFIAAMDETIQIVSSRGSSLLDVWLDFFGCICGMVLLIIIAKLRKKKNEG